MATSESEDQTDPIQEIAFVVTDLETTCSICHAEFLDAEDLTLHVKQLHVDVVSGRHPCQFCDANYSDLEDYAIHIRDTHFFDIKCCMCCTKAFTDLRKAKKHEGKHFGKYNRYSCSQCDDSFSILTEVRLHESLYHDNDKDGVFIKCASHLSALLRLKAIGVFQTEDDKVFTCAVCNLTSLDFNVYIQHLKDEKCQPYVCDICANAYKTMSGLLKHYTRKNRCLNMPEYESQLVSCLYCKKKFLSRNMKSHLRYCKVFKCYMCGTVFESVDSLSKHQSEKHPVEIDVTKCRYCSREYVGQEALEKHIDRAHRHTFHLYKYKCKGCGDIFKHPQYLFRHYFSKHKDLSPYTCKVCNKTFRIRKKFTLHIRLDHKGVGFVEFDKNYHVFFSAEKSEKPFIPQCVIPDLVPPEHAEKDDKTDKDSAESVVDNSSCKKASVKDKFATDHESNDDTEDVDDVSMNENESATERKTDDRKDSEKNLKGEMTGTTAKRQRLRTAKLATNSSDDEEEEPLLQIKKREEKKKLSYLTKNRKSNINKMLKKRRQLTCNICQKYCYTYQNFHNHMNMHGKNDSIECVKCTQTFKSRSELKEHINKRHATSKLIETLKSVIERKQTENTANYDLDNGSDYPNDDCNVSETMEIQEPAKFKVNLKKVKLERSRVPVKVSVTNNSSVKKFFENFMPEGNESTPKETQHTKVNVTHYESTFYREPVIKMKKFTPEDFTGPIKLKMPVRFKEQSYKEDVSVQVRIVQEPIKRSAFDEFDNDSCHQEYDFDDLKAEAIPEVAQEVLLEGSEEAPKISSLMKLPHKIVIPKLPDGYKNIHIGTLQTQAPYFKIIKVDGSNKTPVIVDTSRKPKEAEPIAQSKKNEVIKLPDGTKFVTANPLAHLLGDIPIEEVLTPNKHYKPVRTNFKGMLVNALQNLDKQTPKSKKKKYE